MIIHLLTEFSKTKALRFLPLLQIRQYVIPNYSSFSTNYGKDYDKAIVQKIIRNYGTIITYKLRLEIITNYIKMIYGSSNFPQITDDYYKLRQFLI